MVRGALLFVYFSTFSLFRQISIHFYTFCISNRLRFSCSSHEFRRFSFFVTFCFRYSKNYHFPGDAEGRSFHSTFLSSYEEPSGRSCSKGPHIHLTLRPPGCVNCSASTILNRVIHQIPEISFPAAAAHHLPFRLPVLKTDQRNVVFLRKRLPGQPLSLPQGSDLLSLTGIEEPAVRIGKILFRFSEERRYILGSHLL